MAHIRVFNHYIHASYIVLGLIEYLLLIASFNYANYLRFSDDVLQLVFIDDLWVLRGLTFALIMHCSTLAMGVYSSYLREGLVSMSIRTVVAFCLIGCALYTILHAIVPELYMGNSVLVIAILLAIPIIIVVRWCFFQLVDVSQLKRRVVLYGSGKKAKHLLAELDGDRRIGVEIVGCVPSNTEHEVDSSLCFDMPDDWREFVLEQRISEIVVVPDERRRGEGGSFPLKELLDCKLMGVSVIDAINFSERETGKVELNLLHPSWMLFSDGFKRSGIRGVAKRVFDLFASLVLVLLLWPVMLLTMLAVYIESGGPVIYRQMRVGLNGKEFELLKFRSMRTDAEGDGKAVWAVKNDSRVTRVGNFIRNTRLDELPQLWNVLKGEMSFVGPRPERPEFVSELAKAIPFYQERHRVKPGLMGWAQLNYPYGASVEDAAQKLRYDLYYTKNHSLLLDCLIGLQTIEIILLGKGVH